MTDLAPLACQKEEAKICFQFLQFTALSPTFAPLLLPPKNSALTLPLPPSGRMRGLGVLGRELRPSEQKPEHLSCFIFQCSAPSLIHLLPVPEISHFGAFAHAFFPECQSPLHILAQSSLPPYSFMRIHCSREIPITHLYLSSGQNHIQPHMTVTCTFVLNTPRLWRVGTMCLPAFAVLLHPYGLAWC